MPTVQGEHERLTHPTTGHELFVRVWRVPQPRAAVLLVHGFGEHGGRYEVVASTWVEQGIAVACPDLPGHGLSSGMRGDLDDVGWCLDDLEFVANRLMPSLVPTGRYAVFGHSAGGLLAIHLALRHLTTVTSFVVQSPLLAVGFPVPEWKLRLARWLVRSAPRLRLPGGVKPEWLSHDPAVVEQYRRDPLVTHVISLRGYFALQQAMTLARERVAEVKAPTFLAYGEADHVVDVSACRDFAARLQCEKQIRVYPGVYHELHHEPIRDEVLRHVRDWTLAGT